MNPLRFEWDEKKDFSNKNKHGVSFKEAQSVFLDENALLINDPDHSDGEDRFILLGISQKIRVLIVCHSYRKGDEVIRIISGRKAGRKERDQYFERWKK